jgi:hypothetical protein
MKKGKVIYERFESLNGFLKAINSRKEQPHGHKKTGSEVKDYNFTGTNDYKEAEILLQKGWETPLPEFKKTLGEATSHAPRNKLRTNLAGFMPCVPNAIIGRPDSMFYIKKTMEKVKAITIVYSPAVNCGIDVESVIQAGANLLSAIAYIENNKGVRVNLDVCSKSSIDIHDSQDISICVINIKKATEKLEIKKVCFPLAHPSWQRRFGFKWLETLDKTRGSWHGYGRTIDLDDLKKVINAKQKDAKVIDFNLAYDNSPVELAKIILS